MTRRGFTLVEVIVASVIITLIAGATTVVILRALKSKDSSAARQEAFSRAYAAAQLVAKDLHRLTRERDASRVRLLLTPGGSGASAGGEAVGVYDDVLMLVSTLRSVRPMGERAESPVHEVQYRVKPDPDAGEDVQALWKREDPYPDDYLDAGGVASPVVTGIVGMSVEATDAGEAWDSVWDSDYDGIPHAVRVTVTAEGGGVTSKVRSTARVVVAIDRTPIPKDLPTTTPTSTGGGGTQNPTTPTTPTTPGNNNTPPAGGGLFPGGPGGGVGPGRPPGNGQGGGNGNGNRPPGGGPGNGNGQPAIIPGGGNRPPGGGGGGGGGGGPRGRFASKRRTDRCASASRTPFLSSSAPGPSRPARSRRGAGFAIAMVVWAIGIATLILLALQGSAYAQAATGREAIARVRAFWAARGAVELVINRLQNDTISTNPSGAADLLASLAEESDGQTLGATFRVFHGDINAQPVQGPADAGAKININKMTVDDLMLLPDMTTDIAAAIVDFVDSDDEPQDGGAEFETYGSLDYPFRPRNAPVRSLAELAVVEGVQPEYVRGLDANYDGVVDPVEASAASSTYSASSGSNTGTVDLGWSAYTTAASTAGGYSLTGEARIDLTTASTSEIMKAAGIDSTQAQVVTLAAQSGSLTMEDFIRTQLSTLVNTVAPNDRTLRTVQNLTRDQLRLLYEGASIGDVSGVSPGKLNFNTCHEDTFKYLTRLDPSVADAVKAFRDQSSGNVASVVDLLDVAGLSNASVADLASYLTARSNVFTMTVLGRDDNTGLLVEMQVELDRSTIPVTINSIRIR
jgi:type II secretion system protein J